MLPSLHFVAAHSASCGVVNWLPAFCLHFKKNRVLALLQLLEKRDEN
jgi:hypothetical protein